MTTALDEQTTESRGPKPITEGKRNLATTIAVYIFILVPFAALIAAVPLAWGWGLTWVDVGLFLGFYWLTLLGVTVGYHRHFTHGSFKAKRGLRIGLAKIGRAHV